MTILSKKEMSEEDIKLQYITPAILAKWDKNRITMETKITDGKRACGDRGTGDVDVGVENKLRM